MHLWLGVNNMASRSMIIVFLLAIVLAVPARAQAPILLTGARELVMQMSQEEYDRFRRRQYEREKGGSWATPATSTGWSDTTTRHCTRADAVRPAICADYSAASQTNLRARQFGVANPSWRSL
jgi:hypothetical protein